MLKEEFFFKYQNVILAFFTVISFILVLHALGGNTNPVLWVLQCAVLLPFVLLLIEVLLRSANISLFVPLPLEKTIATVLSDGLKMPLFVTATKEIRSYFDPDYPDYDSDTVPGGAAGTTRQVLPPTPTSRSALTPIYSRVDMVGSDAASDALLASSALPLGVVAARYRRSDGARLVDGGVADNIPWFPLVSEEACDELVIVHCNPSKIWNNKISLRNWQLRDRLNRVIDLNLKKKDYDKVQSDGSRAFRPDTETDGPPTKVPFRQPQNWPTMVINVAPKEPLGGLIMGTLGFSTKICRERLERGLAVGRQAIAKDCLGRNEGFTIELEGATCTSWVAIDGVRDPAPEYAKVRGAFQWVQAPPGNRSSRKQPEQAWRRRNV
jgi:hypothetical protein